MQYHLLAAGKRTPSSHIGLAIWPATLGVVLAVALVAAICTTTNGKDTSESVWTANAVVLVAVGGNVLKGSVGSLVSIALYHRLWLQLGRCDDKAGRSKDGLTVKQIESHHLASRLAIGMLAEPSKSMAWACGLLCLLLTAAIVPMLQYGLDVTPSTTIRPTTVAIQHAQLDNHMAILGGGQGLPDNVVPNVLRAATRALFGAESAFVYKQMNLTGRATFSHVQYADVECKIDITPGQVVPTSIRPNDWYYNITFNTVTPPSRSESQYWKAYNRLYGLGFTSLLNNNTHFLLHDCQIRAAIGSCSVYLNNGTGLMKDLRCRRDAWMTGEQLPSTPASPAVGFYAVVTAFYQLFKGDAYTTLIQGRPFQNSTFVAATARYASSFLFIANSPAVAQYESISMLPRRLTFVQIDSTTIGMPGDLITHVQRTLWHTAINAAPNGMPELEVGGPYDLNSTFEMTVEDETPVLLVSIDFRIIASVLGVATILAVLAIFYLTMANNPVSGRLMRDSLVHTLSVAARTNDGTQCTSVIDLQDCPHTSLEDILRAEAQLRLRAVLASDPVSLDSAPKLALERASQEPMPMITHMVQAWPPKTSPLLSRGSSPRPGPPSSRRSYQMRPPSISPEPSIYRYEPADFQDVSRQYRIHSEPDISTHLPAYVQTGYQNQGYYEPPNVQCHCNDPGHRH